MKKIFLLLVLASFWANVMAGTPIKTLMDIPHFYPVRERLLTQSLNGTWKIKIIKGLEIPTDYHRWKDNDYDDKKWDNIIVPGNWETQGLKFPEYGKDLEPYIGLYRTTFKYNPTWEEKHVILRFDGVYYGYECFINGNKVGEWGSATNLCQFNITPFLHKNKENVLCVQVNTRPMGWLFDTNDCWSLGGITRDVELFTLDNIYLEDVMFTSNITPNLDALVHIRVNTGRFKQENNDYKLNVSLTDTQNNHVLNFSQNIKKDSSVFNFRGEIKNPQLWTAETPNLYRLEVCVVDAKGYVVQRSNENVGIRDIHIDGFNLKINHKPVLLRGVCLNEIDPKLGRALTYKERRQQLEMIKAANINFIRTAHYPFNHEFYELCDEMGFYVCNEIPFGSRGAAYLKQEEYLPNLKARADATLRRDKNHPSVIIWSLGNENPYTPIVEELLKFVKEKDPSRPRGLPQKVSDFMNFASNPSENVDVIMGHYLSDTRIDQAIKMTKKPIIHTEYAHSLGLAFGDFEAKYDRILREEKVIGGSIWCWSDQTIMTLGDTQKNHILKSVWADSLRFIDSYGRSEVPEGKSEIWKEAADGIVYGDGYPQEDYFQVRKVYSPIVVKTKKLNGKLGVANDFNIEVENRFDFISLNGYKIKWKICNVKKIVERGEVWLQIPPRKYATIPLRSTLPDSVDFNDLMLCLEITDSFEKVVYEKNIPILLDNKKDYYSFIKSLPRTQLIQSEISKTKAYIQTENSSFSISNKGIVTITDSKRKVIIKSPLFLRVGRPLTITLDYLTQKDKYFWEPYIVEPIVEKFKGRKTQNGIQVKLYCRWHRNGQKKQYVSGIVNISVSDNGVIQSDYCLTPSSGADGYFLECGLTLKLDSTFDTFRWLGEGPFTYTPGKTMYNKRNCWALHKNDLRFIGNRGLVDIAVATDKQRGIGLWSDNGNIGVENINGSIYISQNAIVTGYGSKFTAPQKRKTMDNLKEIKGTLLLFIDDPMYPISFWESIFKPYQTIVPEQPYMKSYGW